MDKKELIGGSRKELIAGKGGNQRVDRFEFKLHAQSCSAKQNIWQIIRIINK